MPLIKLAACRAGLSGSIAWGWPSPKNPHLGWARAREILSGQARRGVQLRRGETRRSVFALLMVRDKTQICARKVNGDDGGGGGPGGWGWGLCHKGLGGFMSRFHRGDIVLLKR